MVTLDGKVALVTGSTSGIGLAIAETLAAAGADLMINGFGKPEEIAGIVARLHAVSGRKILHSPADMSRADQIDAMVADATARLGKVDILINNAGVQHVAPLAEFPPEKWDLILAVNLSAAFHTTRAVFPQMLARGWGRVINIASAHGLIASPFKSAYVAAKHGMVGLSKAIALEGAQAGVTCNTVCPGYVLTPLVEKQIAEQAKAHGLSEERVVSEILLKEQPTRRFVEASDIGAMVLFLVSDAAAAITGTALPIDGGWTAH